MKSSLDISTFLDEISSLSHPIIFLYFFALFTQKGLSYLPLLFSGILHSVGSIFPFLLFLLLLFSSQLFLRPLQATILPFFFLGIVLITASYTMSQTSIHKPSGTLWDLILYIYLSLPLYNHKEFDLGHTWTVWITTNCGKFLRRWEYQTTLPDSWEICMGVKKQWLELDREQQTGSKLGKEVSQGCIFSQCLYNLYVEYSMWNVRLDEAPAWIKISGRNINNLRYGDDTTFMEESKEELKSLLMKVKEES